MTIHYKETISLAEQVKGRKGTIGEILVEMGFCSFDDITDTLMNSSTDTEKHEDKHEEIHQEPIVKEEPKPTCCRTTKEKRTH